MKAIIGIVVSLAFTSASHGQTPVRELPRLKPPPSSVTALVPQLRFEIVPSGNVELGALVGGDIPVRVTGGFGTVMLVLETGRADVLTLATPSTNALRVALPGTIVAKVATPDARLGDALTGDDKPAVPIERVVRLSPFANLASIGGAIPVTVRATDSKGQQASVSFSILPIAARIKTVSKPAGTVRGQTISLGIDVDLLPPAARLEIGESVAAASIKPNPTSCAFNFNKAASASAPTATAGVNGAARIIVPGSFFAYDSAKTGPCAVVLKGLLSRGNGLGEPIEIRKMEISLATPNALYRTGHLGRARSAFI